MAVSTTVNFNNSANFIFDSTKIEFPGSAAQLALEPVAANFTQAFSSDSGFTYDNTKASFTGSQVQQLDQTAANSLLGAKYASSINANWVKSGSVTGTANGTPPDRDWETTP